MHKIPYHTNWYISRRAMHGLEESVYALSLFAPVQCGFKEHNKPLNFLPKCKDKFQYKHLAHFGKNKMDKADVSKKKKPDSRLVKKISESLAVQKQMAVSDLDANVSSSQVEVWCVSVSGQTVVLLLLLLEGTVSLRLSPSSSASLSVSPSWGWRVMRPPAGWGRTLSGSFTPSSSED